MWWMIEKIQEYIKTYQTEPTKVYLTKKDEYDLLKLGTEDIGYEAVGLMCDQIHNKRPLFCLKILWGLKSHLLSKFRLMSVSGKNSKILTLISLSVYFLLLERE